MQLPVGLLPQNPKVRDQAYAQVNGMGVRAPAQASGHCALTMISEALGKGAKICWGSFRLFGNGQARESRGHMARELGWPT